MGTRLDTRAGAPTRIAVFRALQLGDLLVTVPALRALRRAYPSATITLIGLPWARDFVGRFEHLLDGFVEFPGHWALPERARDPGAVPLYARRAPAAARDAAIQMHGSGEHSNAIVQALGARVIAGYHPAASPSPDPDTFLPWPEHGAEGERWLRLMAFLGIERRGTQLEFPLSRADLDEADALLGPLRAQPFVCMHAGARLRSRRWPLERYAEVARSLLARGWPVVMTGSSGERALTAQLVQALPSGAVHDLTGRTSLGAIGGVLTRCSLLVCNDTGVSHIAAALNVRSVVLATGSDTARWAPDDTRLHRVLFHPTVCRPCAHDACPTGHECAVGLTVDQAVQAIDAALYGAPTSPQEGRATVTPASAARP
jgi:ADP-heptose:LPS heptosyltransferase